MPWHVPEDAMPWVGLYCAVPSLICTLAMTADVVYGFWQWKLWFPNKFFTLNAATITFIAVAMKLPVDLTIDRSVFIGQSNTKNTKINSIFFLVTMLANFLPSLGLMDDKELLTNIVALGILVITIIVNIFIQSFTRVHLLPIEAILAYIFPILWPFSVALTVSTSRKILEHRYKESQQLLSSDHHKKFSSKDLKHYIKKVWMMTETRNPQFVIACAPISCAFGILCALMTSVIVQRVIYRKYFWYGTSVYKWSLKIIFFMQSIGVVVGSIAPMFRCFTSIGHYDLSKKFSKNHLNVFRVEKHWIQRLLQWKRSHVRSHIPGRHCKIVFHIVKNTFLNVCIVIHVLILVICKTVCLVPRTFLILLSYCWHFIKSFFKRFKIVANESLEIEEYTRYVVHIEEEAKLSKRVLRNTVHSITQLLDAFDKKEPKNLLKLLEKSIGFTGVVEFDNDQVPHLYPKETHNCWSLVVVNLTSIVMALSNTTNTHFNGLLSSIREGIQIVRHIEECLNVDGGSVKARKASRRVWTEVELYRTWLQIDLQKKARKGKTSKEILIWLGEEATKFVIHFISSNKRQSIEPSPYKFILASSMYKISQTILLNCNEQENWPNDKELFEWISTILADVLLACFTNLPYVIKMKCYHHAIEKRGDNIRNAAQLLGKSKKILKILKVRQLPNIDQDSIAYIDKWRILLKCQIPNGGQVTNGGASSTRIQQGSTSCDELLIVTIL